MIKKQIGLLAIIALLVSFMAFSGVASAQTSNVTVTFFTSPYCSACQASEAGIHSAVATHGATLVTYDVTQNPGKGIATANGITTTPTVIVSGSQNIVLTGAVTEAQVGSAIEKCTPTPTVKPTATPTVKPTATPTVKPTATPTVKPTATPTTTPTTTPTAKPTATPTIEVVTATPTTKTTTATVPEFSVLGLGAPALLVGAIYLFLRRQ